jgi:hypothetical protein
MISACWVRNEVLSALLEMGVLLHWAELRCWMRWFSSGPSGSQTERWITPIAMWGHRVQSWPDDERPEENQRIQQISSAQRSSTLISIKAESTSFLTQQAEIMRLVQKTHSQESRTCRIKVQEAGMQKDLPPPKEL